MQPYTFHMNKSYTKQIKKLFYSSAYCTQPLVGDIM